MMVERVFMRARTMRMRPIGSSYSVSGFLKFIESATKRIIPRQEAPRAGPSGGAGAAAATIPRGQSRAIRDVFFSVKFVSAHRSISQCCLCSFRYKELKVWSESPRTLWNRNLTVEIGLGMVSLLASLLNPQSRKYIKMETPLLCEALLSVGVLLI